MTFVSPPSERSERWGEYPEGGRGVLGGGTDPPSRPPSSDAGNVAGRKGPTKRDDDD
jgi:hypothetical protein